MDWIEVKTIYTILHIFGAVLGAGGAYLSDAMFFASVKDRVISKVELRFLNIGSAFVWIGLIILLISGGLLFSTNPEGYLASSKFMTKMLVVLVIVLNGVIFHSIHLPRMHRHSEHHYPSSDEFTRNKPLLVASGVVSVTSWTLALILGGLGSIPVTFTTAIIAYIIFEIVAVSVALIFFKNIV